MSIVYIYGLIDPRDNRIRYVGKTNEPDKRLYMHLWHAKHGTSDTYRDRWLRQVLATGETVTMTILEEVSAVNWQERERHWIASLPDLTNTTTGGDGVDTPRTPEWRARIGLAHRGVRLSEEVRRHLREVNPCTHRDACAKGHPYTPETTRITKQGHRECRLCMRVYRRKGQPKANERRRRNYVHHPREVLEVCKHGHPLTGENLRLLDRGGWLEHICRLCVRLRNREAKARAKAKKGKA